MAQALNLGFLFPVQPFTRLRFIIAFDLPSIERGLQFFFRDVFQDVAKLDRLGRDAQDVGTTVKLLAKRKVVVIVLQLGTLDLASPAGKMMLTMLAAVAEMGRDLLVERTQAGLVRAKSEGKTLGRPSKTTAEQRAEIVAKYTAGESVSALARQYAVSRANILGVVKPT